MAYWTIWCNDKELRSHPSHNERRRSNTHFCGRAWLVSGVGARSRVSCTTSRVTNSECCESAGESTQHIRSYLNPEKTMPAKHAGMVFPAFISPVPLTEARQRQIKRRIEGAHQL